MKPAYPSNQTNRNPKTDLPSKLKFRQLICYIFASTAMFANPTTSEAQNQAVTKVLSRAAPQRWEYRDEQICNDRDHPEKYAEHVALQLKQAGLSSFELVSLNEWQGPKPTVATHCFFAVYKRPSTY